MSVSIPDFWKLLVESRLLNAEQCKQLEDEFSKLPAANKPNVRTLAEWLASRRVVSGYQATLLLAGRSGPFYFGEYKVYDRIAQGRLSGWFRAQHTATAHPTMLQFVTGEAADDIAEWAALAERVRQASATRLPGFHVCFEPVDVVSYKFLVWEDLRGESVEQQLQTSRLTVSEACSIARQVGRLMMRKHQVNQTLGDLRPANLWLQKGGTIKVLWDALTPPELMRQQVLAGEASDANALAAADYWAPELADPSLPANPLTEIYALGCTLYHLLSGRPPFAGGGLSEKLSRHASERIEPLEPLGVPPELAQLVAYMMAKNPEVRIQQTEIVATHLEAFVDPTAQPQSPATPRTLGAYEKAILEKRAALAARPKAGPMPPRIEPVAELGTNPPSASAAPSIAIDAGTSTLGLPVRRKKSSAPLIWGLGSSAALVGIIAFAVWGLNRPEGKTVAPDVNSPTVAATNNPETIPTVPEPFRPAQAAAAPSPGDERLLWASPTSGEPLDFRCVPPGARVYLALRPAELLASEEGKRLFEAVGPDGLAARQTFEKNAGVKLEEVEELLISLFANGDKFPRTAYVVRLGAGDSNEALLSRWSGASEQKAESATYYTAGDRAFYIPADGGGKMFAMGSKEDIVEVASSNGAIPAIHRDLDRLAAASDRSRQINLLFTPSFLFGDGRGTLSGSYAKLREPLASFLGEDLQAALLSAHLDDYLYLEMRMNGSVQRKGIMLADDFRQRLSDLPPRVESYVDSLLPPRYWSKISRRFPLMIAFLHDQMRVGAEGDQAVVNAALPTTAAHNLALATELALISTPSPQAAVAAASQQPAKAGPQSMAEVLEAKFSYSTPQESLEFCMRDLQQIVKDGQPGLPFEFTIRIIGKDLEANGITRNQSIRDFAANDKPLAEVLTALCMKANPITTVKEPSETDQKLIWVVAPDPETNKESVLITTRDAAKAKNYTLPKAFQKG